MASAINNGTFTFNPEELKDWSRVIRELVFNTPTLTSLHDVQEGIKHDEQIVFAGRMGLIGKKVTANCTPNEIAGITLSQKFWRPVFEDFRLKHCTTDVNAQDKLVNQMTRMNPDFYNVIDGSQSGVGDFLVASILEVLPENILWKVWFGDKLASTFEDSDGSNTFTNGTDVGYFNSFDGLFKQIMAEISSISNAKYFTSIAKNAGANYAAQTLASNDAINAMKSVWNKADSRLRGRADAKFYVTRSIYDGLVNDLEGIQNAGGFTQTNENGMPVLRYRGVEVVEVELWDRFIDAYQNDGTKWVMPHRIVLTVPTNVPVGTLESDDLNSLEAFYDKVTKQNYIDGVYSLDAKFLEPYLASVAY
jgi:hypothetical protein